MATASTRIMMDEVVNKVVVYDFYTHRYAQLQKEYLDEYKEYVDNLETQGNWFFQEQAGYVEEPIPPDPPTNALEGLNILDVTVQESTKMTSNPVETGVEIVDCKVRMPVTITIKGICDNKRGGSDTTKDTRYGAPGTASEGFAAGISKVPFAGGAINNIVGSVVNNVMGYEYEQEETVLTRARMVYSRIHQMLKDRSVDPRFNSPNTYTISTKGAIYSNMVLESAEQLNDAEHLMVIPVTLKFKELILAGGTEEDNVIPSEDQDGPLTMSGYLKKNSWLDNAKEFGSYVLTELSKPF